MSSHRAARPPTGVIVGVDRTTEPALGDAYGGVGPSFVALDPGAQPWAVLTPVTEPPRITPGRALEAQFVEAGRLVGATVPARLDTRELDLTLFWQADGPTTRPLTVFVHLLDATGRVVAQHDGQPLAASFPTTRWRPGETIVERIRLRLPADLAAGDYRLTAGLYDLPTGARVGVTGRDTAGDAALLGLLRR